MLPATASAKRVVVEEKKNKPTTTYKPRRRGTKRCKTVVFHFPPFKGYVSQIFKERTSISNCWMKRSEALKP